MTEIGDVIQPGPSIPDDVTAWTDRDGDEMWRMPEGWWCCNIDAPHTCTQHTDAEVLKYGPLTVTAVREQPAEPERKHCGNNAYVHKPHEWLGMDDAGDKAVKRWCRGTGPVAAPEDDVPHEHFDAPVRIIEPQQADVSVLVLVQQYGTESYQTGCAERHDEAAVEEHDCNARELYARIAALLPQQPVQARTKSGDLIWQHTPCGWPNPWHPAAQPQGDCRECQKPGPWRPLLVGGDPAPEQPVVSAPLRERDELRSKLAEANAVIQRLKGIIDREETGDLQVLRERDDYHVWADRLADAIAEYLRIDIGEHSNINLPWQAALIALTEASRPQQHQRALIAELGVERPEDVLGAVKDLLQDDTLTDLARVLRERDEARAEVGRLKVAADIEFREWSERQLMDALGVDQLPEVIPAIERLKAALLIERTAEERANAELVEIVKRLDEADVDSGGASERVGYAIQSMQRGWATATENLARLDTVKADRETVRAALNHLKETVTGPAIKALGVQHNEDIVPAIERLLAAQPDPLVLSLPEVPLGTVALVGMESGERRESPGLGPNGLPYWCGKDGLVWQLGAVLDMEPGGVRVEMAPPREPRTWPKLDVIANDLKAVQGASGKIYHRSHFSQSVPVFRECDEDGALIGMGHMFYALQTFDGPLTEVFDDEPGGTASPEVQR